ncbi:hypothetical protein [Nitratireductor rhodophyticola]|uniref:hypothetical protein n=1 Tax=Nitratireductor rhodophyticola TaxID=2854036 RepID=UPI00300B1F33
MGSYRHIDEMAHRAAERFKREQSMQFAECAINLMATSMPIKDVIEWLERQADLLKEFG